MKAVIKKDYGPYQLEYTDIPKPEVDEYDVLIKVKAETRDAREDIIQITNVFRGNIVDFGQSTLIIAVVGAAEKIKAILKLLDDYVILETARTGMVALERGQKTIYDQNKLKEEYNYGKNVL